MKKATANHISTPYKIKLAAIAKNEGPYLAEWIFHHLHIGIDEIEIWINNCEDNSAQILKHISRADARVKFVEASQISSACKDSGKSFQILAYNTIFNTTRELGIHSHILFLDLDEYLIGPKPGSNLKPLINSLGNPSIISFAWQSDSPLFKRKRFGKTIKRVMKVHPMTHVKSLARTDCLGVVRPTHHNYILNSSEEVTNILASGERLDDTNTTQNRQVISRDLAESLKPELGGWFILHAIYRSKLEYCASLTRGRSHNNDHKPLKCNRWGYQIHPDLSNRVASVEWSDMDFKAYKLARKSYFRQLRISKLIAESRNQLIKRYMSLKRLLRRNPGIAKDFSKALAGTNLALIAVDSSATSPDANANSTTYQQSTLDWGGFAVAMPTEERNLLESLYSSGKSTILEYGTGGSTILGLKGGNIVIGAETDILWLNKLAEQIKAIGLSNSFHPCHMDIGATKELGYPKEDLSGPLGGKIAKAFLASSYKPWHLCRSQGLNPDVILVDGRFRVACFLTSLAMAQSGAILLFDDYKDRPHYHVVEKIISPEGYTGRMALFRKAESVDYSLILRSGLLDFYFSPN